MSEITNEPGRIVAAKLDIAQATVSRWRNGSNLPAAEQVIAFARAYGRNPIEALIAAGYLRQDEVEAVVVKSLDGYTDLELAQEVVKRLELAQEPTVFDKTPTELAEEFDPQARADELVDRAAKDGLALAANTGEVDTVDLNIDPA